MRYGGRAEWEAVKGIVENPKNPMSGVHAMRTLGATTDMDLARETFDYLMTKARDQDLFYYFAGLQRNHKTRRFLASAFKEHYQTVRIDKCLSPFPSYYFVCSSINASPEILA